MSVWSKIGIILCLLFVLQSNAQERYRFMFYNVENFFDTFDDSLKNDEEFLPESDRHWNQTKYIHKLNNIYKVITAVGEWSPPELIGLCEIENRFVLEQLLFTTPLSKMEYRIIHFESPDKRGIDVALLYQKNSFTPVSTRKIPVQIDGRPTRDILYVKGLCKKVDTLHVFVNHWPSRWGGQINSEGKRIAAAKVLRHTIDSIFKKDINPKIIITGDLNDHPNDKSLIESLQAKIDFSDIHAEELYNLSYYLQEEQGKWSHKYQEEKGILDQIIVSGSLLNPAHNMYTTKENAHVFSADFLLEKDEQYLGMKPFRTYTGYRYNGGFSDHLPVYLDIYVK